MLDTRLAQWLISQDTRLSSMTLVAHLSGVTPASRVYYPADPDDLGRCIRLLALMPEYRARLPEMADVSPVWRALVEHWDELEQLYDSEAHTGRAPQCYNRMRELIEAAEKVRKGIKA